jgi:glycosyltransferase involved in cell wall biosynthesis
VRIRIAFVSHVFWPEKRRGGERLIRDLSDALIARGHEPTLITSHKAPHSVTNEDGLRVIRQRRPPERPFDRLGLPAGASHAIPAWWQLRRSDADVVQAWTAPAALAAARSGKPSVFVFQGVLNEADLEARPRTRGLLMRAARECDVVTAYSEVAASEFTRITGIEATAIEPGIDLAAFTPASGIPDASGLSPDASESGPPARHPKPAAVGTAIHPKPAAVGAARHPKPAAVGTARHPRPAIFCAADPSEPRKRVELLVEAFAKLHEDYPEAELWLMSPGATNIDRSLLAPLGALSDHSVWVVDPGADRGALIDLYRSAWVTVLPAFREAFGLVVVESLACGTPVIAMSDGGAAPAIVTGRARSEAQSVDADSGPDRTGAAPAPAAAPTPGRTPRIGAVAQSDPDSLADALQAAIATPPDAAVAAACRERAEDFSIDRCAERYESLYKGLLNR